MFIEANSRLKKAIQSRDMAEVELAQAMLEGISKVQEEQSTQKRVADQIQETIEKKSVVLTKKSQIYKIYKKMLPF